MYPDTWGSDHHPRPADAASTPAPRRIRREHRIHPVVAESAATGHPGSGDGTQR
ncbi:MAG: hypothetical protein ACR2LI_17190 [Propionibacteriaceae bacterium]